MSGKWTHAINEATGEALPVYVEELPPIRLGAAVQLVPGAGGRCGIAERFSPDGWKILVRFSRGRAEWHWATEVMAR